jgi:hypothetical protein
MRAPGRPADLPHLQAGRLMPKGPFPWESTPGAEVLHVAVPMALLEAMGELLKIRGGMYQGEERRTVELVLRVAGVDVVTGNVIIGVRIRNLDEQT